MKTALVLLFSIITLAATAQTESNYTPPFKRFPTVPTLQLLLGDSTTKYSKDDLPKDKPLLLMIFSPDCEHCQHETEAMVKNKEAFKDVQLLMVTTHPLYRMNEFVEAYHVKEIPNVVVAKDIYYLLLPFFDVRNFPFIALYDKKGNLVTTTEGSVPLDSLLKMLK